MISTDGQMLQLVAAVKGILNYTLGIFAHLEIYDIFRNEEQTIANIQPGIHPIFRIIIICGTIECTFPNVLHGVRNLNASQAAATAERKIANTRNAHRKLNAR